jgi:photosystem II stability/assembly factor-like uncharacterized protein
VQAASQPHWVLQRSGTPLDLNDISCASPSECVAIGLAASVLRTVNGGKTWTRVAVPYMAAHPPFPARAIRCPAPGVCSVIVGRDVVLRTVDGGRIWQVQHAALAPQLAYLSRLACPTRLVCFATAAPSGSNNMWFDHSAAIFKTGDGGRTWRRLAIPSFISCNGCEAGHTTVGYDLQWISCQSAQSCRAGGDTFMNVSHEGEFLGEVLRTDDGGRIWRLYQGGYDPNIATCPTTSVCVGAFSQPTSPVDTISFERSVDGGKTWAAQTIRVAVSAIACTGPTFCEMVGAHGAAAMSIGSRIFTQASPAAYDLNAVACPRRRDCYAVGAYGTILARQH